MQGSGVVEQQSRLHIAEQIQGDDTGHETGCAGGTLGYIYTHIIMSMSNTIDCRYFLIQEPDLTSQFR